MLAGLQRGQARAWVGEKDNREEFLQVANSRKGRYDHDEDNHDHNYDYDEHDHDDDQHHDHDYDDLLVSNFFSGAQTRERPPDGPEKHGGDNLIV